MITGMERPVTFFRRLEQNPLESLRRPTSEDVLAIVSPVDDVGECSSRLRTRFSGRGGTLGAWGFGGN